jgi:hypothetical protein
VKRPILGLLAAVILSLGLIGPSPARAATSNSPTVEMVTPADDDDHGHDDNGDDDNGDNGHGRRRCRGIIVVCLG